MGEILNLRNEAPEPVLLTATPDCFSQTADIDENIGQCPWFGVAKITQMEVWVVKIYKEKIIQVSIRHWPITF